MKRFLLVLVILLTMSRLGLAQNPSMEPVLPPALPWEGASRSLRVEPNHPWVTPAEQSGFRVSPDDDETVSWLKRLTAASPELEMVSIGTSPEGRELWMVIASRDRVFTPEGIDRSNRAVVLAQGGIHSGEIDGKDAGMMLLRDMTVRGLLPDLLDHAVFLFVPIFNVDGHERSSPFHRINQRGPELMGWRTNAANLNLNRDYTKLDTEEMRAMIRTLNRWRPDLYLDIHVTDGIDYQYDVTFGANGASWSPSIGAWIENRLDPAIDSELRARGHVPGPLVFAVDDDDVSKGIVGWVAGPRFSNGYGDARHLPTILVENHSLKPFEQRVLGTYLLLKAALETAGNDLEALRVAVRSDELRRNEDVVLDWAPSEEPVMTEFLGVASRLRLSEVTGAPVTEWTGEPRTMNLPVVRFTSARTLASRPAAYWVPGVWGEVIERLSLHGLEMETLLEPRTVDVEMVRFGEPSFADAPFEGHIRVAAPGVVERRTERFAAGSVRIPTDQPLGTLVMLLLEPDSPDSYFQWGFFHSILSRTEYVEEYVMEPMAQRMLAADPELAAEFRRKLLEDQAFRGSSRQRLHWFYEKTPFFDERFRLYPVAREP